MCAQPADGIDKEAIARLLDRIGRMSRGLQYCHGLNPAQWDCLRLISQVNRFSRTPGALAAFLGTTRGTASQTLNALEKKGHLSRIPDPDDRRVRYVELTEAGAEILARDPLNCLDRAIGNLPPETAGTMAAGLRRLCSDMQLRCGGRETGICGTCGHLQGETGDGNVVCGYKQAELSGEDAKRLCVNFTPAAVDE